MKKKLSSYGLLYQIIILFAIILSLRLFYIDKWLVNDTSVFGVIGRGFGDGKILYRDFWDHKPPMIYFVFWLSNLFFGKNIMAVSLFEIIYLSVVIVILLVVLNKRFSFSVVLVLGAIFISYASSIFISGSPGMIETYLLLPYILVADFFLNPEQHSKKYYLILGSFIGLTILTKQTSAAVVITMLFFCFLNFKRLKIVNILLIFMGVILPCVCLLVYLVFHGVVMDYLSQVYFFGKYYVESESSRVTWLQIYNEVFLIKYPLLIFTFVFSFFVKKISNFYIFIVWVFLEVVQIVLSRHIYNHYLINLLVPMTFVSVYFFESLFKKLNTQNYSSVTFLAIVLLSPMVRTQSIFVKGWKVENKYTKVSNILLSNRYKTNDSVLVYNDWPHINYYLNANIVGKYIYPTPFKYIGYLTIDDVNKYIDQVSLISPRYVVINNDSFGKNMIELRLKSWIDDYISKYQYLGQIDDMLIYKKYD